MISEQAIRKVISICPKWQVTLNGTWIECLEWSSLSCNMALIPQYVLDALAAEAVRVVEDKGYWVDPRPGSTAVFSDIGKAEFLAFSADKGRTENTLNAIAEFVEKGYLKDE